MRTFPLILLVGVLCLVGVVQAQDTITVRSTGLGVIYSGDIAKARDDAVKDALRNAVEQQTGMFLDSQTMVEMFSTLEDSIYARATAYVLGYNIISEGYGSFENSYEVEVECTIARSMLQAKLDDLDVRTVTALIGNPRIMIIIEEENMLEGYHYYWYDSLDMGTTEMTLQEIFLDKDFPLVDAQQARRNIDRDMVKAALTGDPLAAAEIGLQYGAEYVLTGKAVVKGSDIVAYGVTAGSGMKSYQATCNIKVYETDTATLIASTSKSDKAAHTDDLAGGNEALRKAAKAASDVVIGQILKDWSRRAATGSTVQMTVYNADNATLTKLQTWLRESIRGVENIIVRSHFGLTAKLEIASDYDAAQIAKEINYKPRAEGDFEVIVYGQTRNTVDIAIAPKGETPPKEGSTE
ncbi:MAG TPA: DUF6175 family protein [bacterium]|nr:DUF6175 family protein [bacterium]